MTNIQITKEVTTNDLKDVLGGQIPDYNPPEFINSRLQSKYVFLALVDGKAAGFLIYSIWWGNCPFIELIKVKKSFQRIGVGSKLLAEAKKEIKGKGFQTLISSTEVINNLGLSFHKKEGFEKLNTLHLPHGEEQFYSLKL